MSVSSSAVSDKPFMFNLLQQLRDARHEHRWLGLMLISLHILVWWNPASPWFHLLMALHLCIFLLWQPFWQGRELPDPKNLVVFGGCLLIFLIFLNHWLVVAWQILLIGLLGGRDLVKPRDRVVNITAIIFLTLTLFIVSIHRLFIISEPVIVDWAILDSRALLKYGLLLIPIGFFFVRTEETHEYRHHLDFFHGLVLSLLLIIIALGSLVIMYEGNTSYPLAVFQMSLTTALFILIFSWLWVTFAGDGGIEQLWIRHLINFGVTFEQWLDNLAQPGNYKNLTPEQFLQAGFEQLATLSWVRGIRWHCLYGEDQIGDEYPFYVTISFQSLEVTVFSAHRISGSHYLHIKLLVQLLEHFHQAKRREAAFAQQAHLQAIHETGAKLTHDIKNLLQSLHAITSAIETCQPAQFGDTQRLLQGQMPHLTQRLKRTLDKLQKPAELSYSNVPISLWWGNLKARYGKQNIEFISRMETENILIPEDLFDNVVENLLQNAIMKRKREPELGIEVSLFIKQQKLELCVCDDGSMIVEEVAKTLFSQPVSSRDGFGIGLYQVAKQVQNSGYNLRVSDNRVGQVCFELSSAD